MKNYINVHATLSGDCNSTVRSRFISFLQAYLEGLREKENDLDFANLSLNWDDITQTGEMRIVKNQQMEERQTDIDVLNQDINELNFILSLKNESDNNG